MSAAVYNITIEKGVDFSQTFQLFDPDDNIIDLTGCTAKAQVRANATSGKLIQEFTAQVLSPATDGKIKLSLTAAQTALMVAVPGESISSYLYDMLVTFSDLSVVKLIGGTATLIPGVTK